MRLKFNYNMPIMLETGRPACIHYVFSDVLHSSGEFALFPLRLTRARACGIDFGLFPEKKKESVILVAAGSATPPVK